VGIHRITIYRPDNLMYLTAFLHRDELFDITNRWISNKLEPEDPLQITRIITYDSFSAWETLLLFTDDLLQNLTDAPVLRKKISYKKDLKDFLCHTQNQKSDRVKLLIREYVKMSEFYYIGSPLAGYICHNSLSQILSICRFKRVKRIAEKASRYASMYIFDKVQTIAHELSKDGTRTPPFAKQIPDEILIMAEKRIMENVKDNGVKLPVQRMTIKDVLGIKVIDNDFGENKLESAITRSIGSRIVEKERHSGIYNAVHYVVELKVDFDHLIRKFANSSINIGCEKKGLPAEGLHEDFSKFVATGADTVHVDLIFTSFEELVESEIGRSMHENRIFEQRKQNTVLGNIPINIEYIIEYLIAVGLSPTIDIKEIPIKIWGRYLPDTLSDRIRKLHQIPEYSMIGL
jgi:hypothetical protein